MAERLTSAEVNASAYKVLPLLRVDNGNGFLCISIFNPAKKSHSFGSGCICITVCGEMKALVVEAAAIVCKVGDC